MKKIITVLICLLPILAMPAEFTIDSVNCDMTQMRKYTPTLNYGTATAHSVGDDYIPGDRERRLLVRQTLVADSLAAHSGAVADSLILRLFISTIATLDSLTDTLTIKGNVLLIPFTEGLGTIAGEDTCGADFDQANDTTGEGGGCINAHLAWNTAGALGSMTDYDTTTILLRREGGGWGSSLKIWRYTTDATDGFSIGDTVFFKITNAALIDSFASNGIVIGGSAWVSVDDDCYMSFVTDDEPSLVHYRPGVTVYYTIGGGCTAPPAMSGGNADSVSNDYDAELDEIDWQVTASDSEFTGYVKVCWSSSGYPDSAVADSAHFTFVQDTTYSETIAAWNGTETYTLYFSAWAVDTGNSCWSTRHTWNQSFTGEQSTGIFLNLGK